MLSLRKFRKPHGSTRDVLVHYHLFKNGGTSIERMLKNSFEERWTSYDKVLAGSRISGSEMQSWLEANPEIRAVSSHQLVPPIPVGDFNVVPLIFLRHPLLRVRSAWMFEWKKQLGLDEPRGSLAEYVKEKLNDKNTGVILNFQVGRLGWNCYDPGAEEFIRHKQAPLRNAIDLIDSLRCFGLVEQFSASLGWIAHSMKNQFPELVVREYHLNAQDTNTASIDERVEALRQEIGIELMEELCRKNEHDLQLYQYACGRFNVLASQWRHKPEKLPVVA